MAKYHVRDRTTGATVTLDLPEGASPDAIAMAASQAFAGKAAMVHTPQVSPFEFDAPEGFKGETIGFGQGVEVGRHGGNPAEIQAALGGQLIRMKDKNQTMFWRKDDTDTWKIVNKPGLSMDDVSGFIGGYGPQMAGSLMALAASGGTSLPAQIGAAALGGFIGKGADESLQEAQGTQRDTPLGATLNAAGAGFEEGAGGALGGLIGRLAPALPGGHLGLTPKPIGQGDVADAARRTVEGAATFARDNPSFPDPMRADVFATLGGGTAVTAPPLARGMVGQTERLAGAIGAQRSNMMDAADAAIDIHGFRMPPTLRPDVGRAVQGSVQRAYDTEVGQLGRYGAGAEAGATAGREAANTGLLEAKRHVSRAYEQGVAEAVAREQPIFDLAPVKESWRQNGLIKTETVPSGLLDNNGRPIMAQVQDWVQVAPTAEGKIGRMKALLMQMDDRQTDFEALKQVRTIARTLAKDPALRTAKEGQAARLEGELTQVIRNPVNADQTPGFFQALDAAEALGRTRGQLIKNPTLKGLLNSTGSENTIKAFAHNPTGLLDPQVRHALAIGDESSRDVFLSGIRTEMLRQANPRAAYDELVRRGNREVNSLLFPNQAVRDAFERRLSAIETIRNSPLGATIAEVDAPLRAYETAVKEMRGEEAVGIFRSNATPQDITLMQQALIDDAVRGSLAQSKHGVDYVNPQALHRKIADLKDRQVWDLLTPEQRTNVTNMEHYYRLLAAKTGDVGSALETSGIIGALREGARVWDPASLKRAGKAVSEILTSRALSRMLSKKAGTEELLKRLNAAPRNTRPWVMFGAVAEPIGVSGQ